MVTVGQLRHRLVFVKDVKTSDGEGGYTTTKTTDFSLWGSLVQLSASQSIRAGQDVGYNNYECWVIYQSDKIPTLQHVISCNGKTFTINGINEIEDKNRWFRLSLTRN